MTKESSFEDFLDHLRLGLASQNFHAPTQCSYHEPRRDKPHHTHCPKCSILMLPANEIPEPVRLPLFNAVTRDYNYFRTLVKAFNDTSPAAAHAATNSALDKQRQINKTLRDRCDRLADKNEELHKTIDTLRTNIGQVVGENDKLVSVNNELENNNLHLKNVKSLLEEKVEDITKENIGLREANSKLRAEYKKVQADNEQLRASHKNLNDSSQGSLQVIEVLRSEVKSLETEEARLRDLIDRKNDEITRHEKEESRLRDVIMRKNAIIKDTRNEYFKMKDRYKRSYDECAKKDAELKEAAALTRKTNELAMTLAEKMNELESLASKVLGKVIDISSSQAGPDIYFTDDKRISPTLAKRGPKNVVVTNAGSHIMSKALRDVLDDVIRSTENKHDDAYHAPKTSGLLYDGRAVLRVDPPLESSDGSQEAQVDQATSPQGACGQPVQGNLVGGYTTRFSDEELRQHRMISFMAGHPFSTGAVKYTAAQIDDIVTKFEHLCRVDLGTCITKVDCDFVANMAWMYKQQLLGEVKSSLPMEEIQRRLNILDSILELYF